MTTEQIDYRILARLTAEQAHAFRVVPVKEKDGILVCVGEDNAKLPQLQLILGQKVQLENISTAELQKLLLQHYPMEHSARSQITESDESDIVRFVNKVMEEAAAMKASDIHIERYEESARIRFRWEGQLIEKYEVPLDQYNALISRIKILSDLDISERRLPQDGRINVRLNQKTIDIRVSTVPGKYGEKAVLRLLTRSEEHLDLTRLGMLPHHFEAYQQAIKQPNGIVLITGPTGSGKSTTLYATLNQLNQPDCNIMTIEDPIEYNLSGINQIQLKESIGLTFDAALRAFLRQDPNIIMVGEIRDTPTAKIAIRASLAGRLVFSTLHTNSAWDAIARLTDMGVEPYLLAASLRMVVAQRLVRVLCPNCKQASTEVILPEWQEKHDIETHYVANGCPQCFYTGYAGRQAIFDVLPIDREVGKLIKYGAEMDESNGFEESLVKLVRDGGIELLIVPGFQV
ncbi:MAG: GspE/PulE family protein [Bacteroidota bacterium]